MDIIVGLRAERALAIAEELAANARRALDGDHLLNYEIEGMFNGPGNRRVTITFGNEDMELAHGRDDIKGDEIYVDLDD